MKVIFHVDELAKWDLTIKNVNNLLAAKPDATVEVLANAEAVKYFITDEAEELASLGATFLVCGNALKAHEISEEDVPSFLEVVPAGVVELAKKQDLGYAYIRP